MRQSMSLAIVTLFALGLGLTAPVQADQHKQPGMQPGAQQGTSQPGMASPGQSGDSHSKGAEVIGSSYTAQVTGEVTSVDQSSGKLTLRTGDGELTATFPPMAVQNVKKGDRVTVAIGLLEMNQPSASPGMGSGSGSGSPSGSPSDSTSGSSPSQPSGPSTR